MTLIYLRNLPASFSIHVQILNGVMYHLVLLVGTSTCRENEGSNGDSTICVENQLYSEKICHVQIHRSWADESPLNAKVNYILSLCEDYKRERDIVLKHY